MDQVEDKVQQPLLEQTEEKKTKLPFCIFLLSNGAVGTWKLIFTNVQELVFSLLHLLWEKLDGEWV